MAPGVGISEPNNADESRRKERRVLMPATIGDGVTDDTAAINAAINAGNPCNKNCVSLSQQDIKLKGGTAHVMSRSQPQ